MIIKNNDLYKKDTLCIFTDASIYRSPNDTIGCPGYVCMNRGSILEQNMIILHNTTSNNSEIYAILMGVLAAIKYKDQFRKICLFSDSQLCIFALRDRIFKWINNISDEGKLLGSEKKEIANQNIILEIIYNILYYDLKIEFYHQKGHVKLSDKNSIFYAMNTYCISNGFRCVDHDLIVSLSEYNNYIDNSTRQYLKSHLKDNINTSPAINFYYNEFDINKYKNLINKKGNK